MRYYLTLLALMASFCVSAQCDGVTRKVDEFTGSTETAAPGITLVRKYPNNIYLELWRKDSTTVFDFRVYDVRHDCASYDSYVILLLDDGNTVKIEHLGDVDCSERFRLAGVLDPGEREILEASPVKKMRVLGDRYYVDYEVKKPEAQVYIQKNLSCLY